AQVVHRGLSFVPRWRSAGPGLAVLLRVGAIRLAAGDPLVGRLPLERAGHAVGAAASTTELEALDRDHLDAGLAQLRVGVGVALVGHDHARLQGDQVVAVVPLLALGLVLVAAGRDHAYRWLAERGPHRLDQPVLLLLDHQVVGRVAGAHAPDARAGDHAGEGRDRVPVDHRDHRVEVHVAAHG